MITLVDTVPHHPWGKNAHADNWETRQYEAANHVEAWNEAKLKEREGWSIWLVSNTGQPGFVIYRKVEA